MKGIPARRGTLRTGASALLLVAGSAALFVSLNARRSTAPLQATFPSAEAAAAAVIEAMQARDLERARRLALTEDEFRDHVWPTLPASRPERNVPFEFAWNMLHQSSESHLRQTVASLGNAPMIVESVRFLGEATDYGNVTVHRDSSLLIAAADGAPRSIRLFGSMIEQDGRWKIFSYVIED